MNTTTILLIAISAFILGFFVNEYRHQSGQSHGEMTHVEEELTRGRSTTLSSTPNASHQSGGSAIINNVSPQNAIFSLEQAQQLLTLNRHEEAIDLLQLHINKNNKSAQAWLLLAQAYEQQGNHEAALDAWFRYLEYEIDVVKRERTAEEIKRYLLQLYAKPSLVADKTQWLIAQMDALLGLSSSDGELHVILASLYAQLDDNYQAQYHALMAANDPKVQKRAEDILAQLDGAAIPGELSVPLVRFGNQYLVNVTIEGNPARLLLDTGASISGVSNSYTARYPAIVKSTKPIRLNTASGVEYSYLFTVDTMNIDSLTFNQHILALLPMHDMTYFDGLLGVDILGRFDFIIDQDALLLKLHARKK